MIERGEKLKTALQSLCRESKCLKGLVMEEKEWLLLQSISKILEKFDRETKRFSMRSHLNISR